MQTTENATHAVVDLRTTDVVEYATSVRDAVSKRDKLEDAGWNWDLLGVCDLVEDLTGLEVYSLLDV